MLLDQIIYVLVLGSTVVLGLAVAYLLLLTFAGLLAGRPTAEPGMPRTRFAVLVPAHDEELGIEGTLAALARLNYPSLMYEVYVVADNCSDSTARLVESFARLVRASAGPRIAVHERHDTALRGKGHALRWLLERLQQASNYDAFAVIDADCVVSPNLLSAMDARLRTGSDAVQVWNRVARAQESWVAGLRFIAFSLINYVRPLGKTALGLSCGLGGTGMAFTAALLREEGWDSYSQAEDGEQHLKMVLRGHRIAFAPEAYVESEMPGTLAAAYSQNLRWESGKIALVRRYALPLLGRALRGNAAALDSAFSLLVPPLSILAALLLVDLGIGALLGFTLPTIIGIALVAGLGLHVAIGLLVTRPPRAVYRSLLYVPVFLVWKLRLYGSALARRGRGQWVRTARSGEALH